MGDLPDTADLPPLRSAREALRPVRGRQAERALTHPAQRRADRLRAQCDMLRIALDDEQIRRAKLKTETEQMVSLLKEYIALPDQDRASHTAVFCAQAASRLSAVECALMED